ncbi:MAG TPA: hypothetical protein VGK59_13875 [Ohtaekwangia sp.]
MRVIGEIPDARCKITLFAWNNRYLLKFERGLLEQTFKVNEFDVTSEQELRQIVDDAFIEAVIKQFDLMENNLSESMKRNHIG